MVSKEDGEEAERHRREIIAQMLKACGSTLESLTISRFVLIALPEVIDYESKEIHDTSEQAIVFCNMEQCDFEQVLKNILDGSKKGLFNLMEEGKPKYDA